jgi:hypothetical protein
MFPAEVSEPVRAIGFALEQKLRNVAIIMFNSVNFKTALV